MRARDALKLCNRDEVEVRIDGRVKNGKATLPFGRWAKGYVVGDPIPKNWSVVVDVQTMPIRLTPPGTRGSG